MNSWIVVTDEGVTTQDAPPLSRDEINQEIIRKSKVKVVIHWVYQGTYTDNAVDVDLFIKREQEGNKATVEDVQDAFQALEDLAQQNKVNRLKASLDVDDTVMHAVGWEKQSLKGSSLNPFTNESDWLKDLNS
jgi:hypothetical protein